MDFINVQIRTLIEYYLRREGNFNDVMEWILNALMCMRASMPGEHSVITLIGKVAMQKKA